MAKNNDRVKTFIFEEDLSKNISQIKFHAIEKVFGMRTMIYMYFNCLIHRLDGKIVPYHFRFKTRSYTLMSDILENLEIGEIQWLDLDNDEVWRGSYLPSAESISKPSIYEGCVEFHVSLNITNKPLMGNGPLPNWIRNQGSLYSLDGFEDNLCV